MKILVTGSSGHLGEALVRTLRERGHEVAGLDSIPRAFTSCTGSITDRDCVKRSLRGAQVVFHTATLHKPHIATHRAQDFVDTNITGTLCLLDEAGAAGVSAFIFTSTTSVFGDALVPPPGAPAAWITEDVAPLPKNIYGVTKLAAEDLCQLFHRNERLPCLVLRTSRFFPEEDDDPAMRGAYVDENLKVNEYLHRRVELEDVVNAHLLAAERASTLGFGRYIISATTPFLPEDLIELRANASQVVRRRVPGCDAEFARRQWKLPPTIDRVYVNERARRDLGWRPRFDFPTIIERLRTGEDIRSPLARSVGAKGYHPTAFTDGPYPVR